MRTLPPVAIAFLLTSCAAIDRPAMSTFEPFTSNGTTTFRYKAKADPGRKPESAEAEAERMTWLGMYLADNKLCGAGYTIQDRKVVLMSTALLGSVHDVIYTGQCK